MSKVILWANSFLLCFLISLMVFNYYSFNENFYRGEFEKNNVYEKIPEADLMAEDLMLYFLDKNEQLLFQEEYSEREMIHLSDVKELFQKEILLLFIVSIAFIALLAVQFLLGERLIKTVFLGSIITIIVSSLLSLSGLFFSKSFATFHNIFFSNDYWLLPEGSILITLFPQQFFADFFVHFIIARLIVGFALLALSLLVIYRNEIRFMKRFKKKKQKKSGMKKKGIEVGINFFVILIISLVVFIFAMTFAFRFFGKAEEYKRQVDENTRREIENLVISQGNKVAVYPTQLELRRGESESIGIGILNTGFERTFQINHSCKYVGEEGTGNQCDDITVVYLQAGISLKPNEDEIQAVSIRNAGAYRGTYILSFDVKYPPAGQGTQTQYGDIQKVYVTSR